VARASALRAAWLAKKRTDLRFAASLVDEAPREWRGQIDQVLVEGNLWMTEVLFFHRSSGTCLVGDLVQRHENESLTTWERWIMKVGGVFGPDGNTPRDARLTFLHRARAREAISRAVSWAPRRLVIAHGTCAMEHGANVLRRSFRWLLGAGNDDSARPAPTHSQQEVESQDAQGKGGRDRGREAPRQRGVEADGRGRVGQE
jgi:hypothetical protein